MTNHILLSMQILLNLFVLLAVALLLGWACRRIHLPALIGEIGAGIILGPTLFSHPTDAATLHRWLLMADGLPPSLRVIIGAASIILLFYYGTTMRLDRLPKRLAVLKFAAWSVTVPVLIGTAVGFISLLPSPTSSLATAAILAVLFAISALPVIVRIFHDLHIHHSQFGATIIAVASVTDVICWMLLSLVLVFFAPNTNQQNIWAFVACYGLLLAGFFVLRHILRFLSQRYQPLITKDAAVLGVVAVSIFGGGWLARQVGIDMAIVSFLVGVMVARYCALAGRSVTWVRRLALWICGPIFFSSVGLRTNFALNFQLGTVITVIGIAYLSKTAAGWWGSRSLGWSYRLRLAAGVALSARGAMDIIIATIALETALISPVVFEAFVIMAIVTSITTYLVRPIARVFLE